MKRVQHLYQSGLQWVTRTWKFLKPYRWVYPDSCERDLKPFSKVLSNSCGFGERIHWFRADERLIRVKIYPVLKKYLDSSGGGLTVT